MIHNLFTTALLITVAFARGFSPDAGGGSGSGIPEGQTIPPGEPSANSIAEENAELEEQARELGIEIPSYPATATGIQQCRDELKKKIAEKRERDAVGMFEAKDEEEEDERPDEDEREELSNDGDPETDNNPDPEGAGEGGSRSQ